MKRELWTRTAALAAAGAVCACLILPSDTSAQSSTLAVDGQGNVSNPRLLPPGSKPHGTSYGEWGARWWQWAYSLPAAGHPLFDETGADCGAGQSGPVWFLGGVFNVSGTAVRNECVIPPGKTLFFPILNAEWDNFCPPVDPPLSEAELRTTVAGFMDLATDMTCEVDGQSVGSIERYRSPGPSFGVQLPDGNLWQAFGCDIPAGSYSPLVPDGYYIMLAPLSPGAHTIHFRGTIGPPVNFTLEITYHLTVSTGPNALAGGSDSPDVVNGAVRTDGDGSPAESRTTWGRVKTTYR